MLQKFAFIDGWLPRIGPHGQDNSDLEIYAMLGLPIPSRESPILITPGFQAHYWDNIIDPNLPHNVYDFYLETLWVHKWSEDFETYLGATPGWHGDWENKHEKAWRLEVQAIGNYTYSPTMKFIFGAKYLDRKDVLALPIVGFIWTPNDDIKYEAVFPKPKLAHRICCNGHNEWWCYLAGELGGGIWGIEHSDGTLDVVRSRDYRVFLGVEDRMLGGWTGRLEIGYVFGRKIEFENTGATDKPADTLMLRTGLIY
jgi:hypothetical protein